MVSASPLSVPELVDCLKSKHAWKDRGDSLFLAVRPDWSRQNLLSILKAVRRHGSTITTLQVSVASNLNMKRAEALAEVLRHFGKLQKLEFHAAGLGQHPPHKSVNPEVMDCLLRGATRTNATATLQEVSLDQNGGPDAIVEFLEQFSQLQTVTIRNLSCKSFAHGLALGLLHLKQLASLKLAHVGSAVACLQLFAPLALLPLQNLEVSTSLNATDTVSIVKSLKVLCQCIPTLERCTFDSSVGGASGTDVRHFLSNARLSPSITELSLNEMTFPSLETLVLPKPNATLTTLTIGETLFHPNSLALLHTFEQLHTLALYGCAGEGIDSVSCWINLLQQLHGLHTLKLDLSHLCHEVMASIANCVQHHPALTTLHLDIGVCSKAFPALQELVGGCHRGTLSIGAYQWAPVNLSYVCSGLATQNKQRPSSHLQSFRLDLDDCHHTNEEYLSLLVALRDHASELHTLHLGGGPFQLDHDSGCAMSELLEAGNLRSLTLRDFTLSLGFVRNLSNGLMDAKSLVSLDVRSCTIESGSLHFLASSFEVAPIPLQELSINTDGSSTQECAALMSALPRMRRLKALRLAPAIPTRDAARRLLSATRRSCSLQTVCCQWAPGLTKERTLIDFYTRVNQKAFPLQKFRAAPGRVPQGLWTNIVAHVVKKKPSKSSQFGMPGDSVHILYHVLLRRCLPTILRQRGEF